MSDSKLVSLRSQFDGKHLGSLTINDPHNVFPSRHCDTVTYYFYQAKNLVPPIYFISLVNTYNDQSSNPLRCKYITKN
ncbi:hypothetical protein VCRA2113O415_350023 [Vibrio crassostreae]|nr:hypothetical protein VCRA2113O415_350023 [Vibrio crassostreae]